MPHQPDSSQLQQIFEALSAASLAKLLHATEIGFQSISFGIDGRIAIYLEREHREQAKRHIEGLPEVVSCDFADPDSAILYLVVEPPAAT